MKTSYLFPHKYKKIGWAIFIPFSILGLIMLITNLEPSFLDASVPAFFVDEIFGKKSFFGIVENNLLNELVGILVIVSGLLVAFSKEKQEDEFIEKIRLESLVWATFVNYGILLLAMVLVYDISFIWVMIFNMFTILIFFIVRFNWQIQKFKKSVSYEE